MAELYGRELELLETVQSRHMKHVATSQSEVTALFNAHVSAEHAEQLLEHIPKHSIVMYEQTNLLNQTDRDTSDTFRNNLSSCLLRAMRGADDDFARSCAEKIAQEPIVRCPSYAEYPEFNQALQAGLVARECIRYPMEYLPPSAITDGLRRAGGYLKMHGAIDSVHAPSLANHEQQTLKKISEKINNAHNTREVLAVDSMTRLLSTLIRHTPMKDLAVNEGTGRFRVYTIFGSAHRYSFTDKLIRNGYTVSKIIDILDGVLPQEVYITPL